jgi:hypothetical protein
MVAGCWSTNRHRLDRDATGARLLSIKGVAVLLAGAPLAIVVIRILEEGPIPAVYGAVRWRACDLIMRLHDEFGHLGIGRHHRWCPQRLGLLTSQRPSEAPVAVCWRVMALVVAALPDAGWTGPALRVQVGALSYAVAALAVGIFRSIYQALGPISRSCDK